MAMIRGIGETPRVSLVGVVFQGVGCHRPPPHISDSRRDRAPTERKALAPDLAVFGSLFGEDSGPRYS